MNHLGDLLIRRKQPTVAVSGRITKAERDAIDLLLAGTGVSRNEFVASAVRDSMLSLATIVQKDGES